MTACEGWYRNVVSKIRASLIPVRRDHRSSIENGVIVLSKLIRVTALSLIYYLRPAPASTTKYILRTLAKLHYFPEPVPRARAGPGEPRWFCIRRDPTVRLEMLHVSGGRSSHFDATVVDRDDD